MCVAVSVCVCVHACTEGYDVTGGGGGGGGRGRGRGGGAGGERETTSLPPQLQSITTPLPPFLKAAGLRTVKVQSDRSPPSMAADGALCSDYTKLRPHKIR